MSSGMAMMMFSSLGSRLTMRGVSLRGMSSASQITSSSHLQEVKKPRFMNYAIEPTEIIKKNKKKGIKTCRRLSELRYRYSKKNKQWCWNLNKRQVFRTFGGKFSAIRRSSIAQIRINVIEKTLKLPPGPVASARYSFTPTCHRPGPRSPRGRWSTRCRPPYSAASYLWKK